MSTEISLIYEFAVQLCQGYLPCRFLAHVPHLTCSSSVCEHQQFLEAVWSVPSHDTALPTAADIPGKCSPPQTSFPKNIRRQQVTTDTLFDFFFFVYICTYDIYLPLLKAKNARSNVKMDKNGTAWLVLSI